MPDLFTPSPLLLFIAFILDAVFGDPVYKWHPIRLCGNLLSTFEQRLRAIGLDGYGGGTVLFLLLALCGLAVVAIISFATHLIHPMLFQLWHLYLLWSLIALGDLCRHGYRVGRAAKLGNTAQARRHVSMLVGRDTDKMSSSDCCRAAVESISENLTDGVISPLFYYLIAGLPGIIIFKIVSTMDSMVGYKDARYRRFGWCGARLDDLLNYLPARLTWALMTGIAYLLPGFDGKGCARTGREQHHILPGPNSGWSEAGAAGALNLKLVGPIWRNGQLATDIWLGPENGSKHTTCNDIIRMNLLASLTTLAAIAVGVAVLALL